MSEVRSLVSIAEATRMLAEARSLEDVRGIRDLAEAARVYARAHALGIEAENHAADIKVLAERKAGELIAAGKSSGAIASVGRPEKYSDATSISELGITHDQSSRWQTIAAMPQEDFEAEVEAQRESGRLSSEAVYQAAKGNSMAVHYSSNSPEWYTPREVVQRVAAAMGGIDLDPCSNSRTEPNVPAEAHFTAENDGLAQPWFGRVYMNPPYGRVIGHWIEKLASEYEAGRVTEAIALVPARTDTAWFRRLPSAYLCFVSGRLEFSQAGVGAPFPSALFYLGERSAAFLSAFADFGMLYRRLGAEAVERAA